MKKITSRFFVVAVVLLFSSCSVFNKFKSDNTVYYSKNINKSIHNIEVLQRWIEEDYQAGLIPKNIANNYFLVLENTKMGLYKKEKITEIYISI